MSGRGYDPLKRVIDVLVSGIGLVITLPVQAVIALVVRRRIGRPVLFRQSRPGKDGSIFVLVKFRTMLEPDDDAGLVSDEDRLTRFGSALRSTSLDELPTLWNVFKGEMSLVGPRPLLVKYLDRYTPEQRRRHEVRPGITGLAQVSGRNLLSWEERFRLDLQYVDHRSLAMDVQIILRTVVNVLRREGISAADSATMTEFGA